MHCIQVWPLCNRLGKTHPDDVSADCRPPTNAVGTPWRALGTGNKRGGPRAASGIFPFACKSEVEQMQACAHPQDECVLELELIARVTRVEIADVLIVAEEI